MTDSAARVIQKASFNKEGMMEIVIGRMKIVVDFKTATIATIKDGEIVDRFNFQKNYPLSQFGVYIDNVINSEKKLGGL